MRDMQMDKTELGCLRAIVLFNPGTTLYSPLWPSQKCVSNDENLKTYSFSSWNQYCKQIQIACDVFLIPYPIISCQSLLIFLSLASPPPPNTPSLARKCLPFINEEESSALLILRGQTSLLFPSLYIGGGGDSSHFPIRGSQQSLPEYQIELRKK